MATVPKSFFKFCFDDFATKLSIPAAFVEAHGLHRHRQLSLHLKTQPAGGSWAVKIKKTNGVFHLTDGWSKFVKDNNLLEMKLLVFYIVGDSTLHVSIFGQDSCLELPSSSSGEKWRFVRKLKDYHFVDPRLAIPKDFAASTGIGKKGEIDVEDWKGRKWPITVTDRNEAGFSFRGGWKTFLRANKLEAGAILLFEFASDSDDVIKVVLMEDEAGEKLLARAKHGGSIPS